MTLIGENVNFKLKLDTLVIEVRSALKVKTDGGQSLDEQAQESLGSCDELKTFHLMRF